MKGAANIIAKFWRLPKDFADVRATACVHDPAAVSTRDLDWSAKILFQDGAEIEETASTQSEAMFKAMSILEGIHAE